MFDNSNLNLLTIIDRLHRRKVSLPKEEPFIRYSFPGSIDLPVLLSKGIKSSYHWAIPENIRTVRRTAFWNSEGKGGFFELEFRRQGGGGGGGYLRLEFRRHRGVSDLGFPEGTDK